MKTILNENFNSLIQKQFTYKNPKAQGITVSGDRYWRNWNEAVKNYNGKGDAEYEKNVYEIYEKGIDNRDEKNPITLWIFIFVIFSFLLGGIVFGVKIYNNQGKTWLSFENDSAKNVEYVLTANVVHGFRVNKKAISKLYNDGRNSLAITKESNPDFYFQNLFDGPEKEIVVAGKNIGDNLIYYVMKETSNGFDIIPIITRYGNKELAFSGHAINFTDEDKDGIKEVKEAFYLNYSNASDQVWYTWYKYNTAKGLYEFLRVDKEKAKDWWWL